MRRLHFWRRLCIFSWLWLLLAAASADVMAADSCLASFSHGGTVATGLSFSASRTVPDLSPRDAIDQYKRIAASEGFSIDHDRLRSDRGELDFSQPPSINARGFDLRFVAGADGKMTVSTTLPPGMDVKPEAVRSNLCEALGQLAGGKSSPSGGGAPAAAPAFAPSPQQITGLCLANAMVNGTSVVGQTFSTWSIGTTMDVPDAVASIKKLVQASREARVTTEISHGNKASLTLSFVGSDGQGASASSTQSAEGLGTPIRMDLDSSLDAASFTAQLKPNQPIASTDPLRRFACTLIAAALNGAPLPQKKASRFHFRNPFKNEQTAAQKDLDEEVSLMRRGRDLLYAHAVRAGKAIVFVPMLNIDRKYAGTDIKSLIPGGANYPSFRFDQTANVIWRAVEDHDDLLKVGNQVSLFQEGIFGSVQTVHAGKSLYGVYIVDPGRYELTGLTYQQPHAQLPSLSSEHWKKHLPHGSATFVMTRNAEFHDSQMWFDAIYQNVTVDDGSYCTATWTPGSIQGCAHWERSSHNETRLVDPGGWRTVTDMDYAGGLAVSVKLDEPFARFETKAGQVIVTDGFVATQQSLDVDTKACRQAGEKLIHCGFRSLTLFRVPGSLRDMVISADTAKKVPMLAGLMSKATYQPATLQAKKLPEKPGTYEAAWAVPYQAPAR